jgi:hypothetical protein
VGLGPKMTFLNFLTASFVAVRCPFAVLRSAIAYTNPVSLYTKPGQVRTSGSWFLYTSKVAHSCGPIHFSLRTGTSCVQPTTSENMTFSSKSRNMSVDLCYNQLGNTLFRPIRAGLATEFSFFFELCLFWTFFLGFKKQNYRSHKI